MKELSKTKKCIIYFLLAGTITVFTYEGLIQNPYGHSHLPEKPFYNLVLYGYDPIAITRSAYGVTAVAMPIEIINFEEINKNLI